MKDTKNYEESRQLHIEGYSLEARVELEDKEKVHSSSLTSKMNQDDQKACNSRILEDILERENMNKAFKRVKNNKGSHGIDGLRTDELLLYLKEHGAQLRESLLSGTYAPQAVRRVEIPKDGGLKRKLGIPTVIDRVVQQAITQVLSPVFEETFSENSYGFRPN